MNESSIFVMSSLFEGLPLVLQEAMSCGLPVISYACPCGPKEMIDDGKNGFLVDVGDEIELANKMMLLIHNKLLRKEMGAAARTKSEQYSIDQIVQQWMCLFNELSNRTEND